VPDSSESHIQAEPRTEFGKGAARRIRRQAKVPAVLYGHGAAPVHITLPGHETMLALKHGGANALLTITVNGQEQMALPKQIQRDPIKGFIEHLDLLIVRRGEKVTVDVPVHVTGEAEADALVVTETSTVSVEAEATHIPEHVEVSVEGAKVGDQIFAKDLQVPRGTTVLLDADTLVVNITHAPTAEELEEELAGAEADAGIEREQPEAEATGAEEGGDEGAGSSDASSEDASEQE
jgi:large subunit ribosomal protein L25